MGETICRGYLHPFPGEQKLLSQAIEVLLTDEQRPGAPATFTFEQFMQIMAVACETPAEAGYLLKTWATHTCTHRLRVKLESM